MSAQAPKLSVILATDTYQTIRPVIDRLRKQTARDRIEVVLIAPSADLVQPAKAYQQEFAGMQIVEDPVTDLAPARAAGIRAATAPFVFVGETHSYPHPGLAEAIIRRMEESWSVIIPAFGNANPKGVLSWAGFLSDYGPWLEGGTAGEVTWLPIYNAAFRRDALLALGDRLAPALSHGDELPLSIRSAGHKAFFEPAARLDHVNVAMRTHWARERFASGIMIAASRSSRWPLPRRVLYVLASPLIPVVLCSRVLPGAWRVVREKKLPMSTILWIVFGMGVKGLGEMAGYAGARVREWENRMHEYEVHKLAYAGEGRAAEG
jgi:hypothetical protein